MSKKIRLQTEQGVFYFSSKAEMMKFLKKQDEESCIMEV